MDQSCSRATTSDCLSANDLLCTCSETGSSTNKYVLTCNPQPEIPGCPLRCIPTRSVTDAGDLDVASPIQLDALPSDTQLGTMD
jgi:hypothetical protein